MSMVLPVGKHWGLDIYRPHPMHTGPQVSRINKLVWHTTEGTSFITMDRVLRNKEAEPHILIDPHSGRVIQYMNLDEYARALEHPSGTPETNRAGCVQVEVCGFARDSQGWPLHYYENLAALAVLIEHRVNIPRKAPRRFTGAGKAARYAPGSFAKAAGHIGHEHVPSQPTGHWDPGAFNVGRLFACMRRAERKYNG